MPGQDNRKRKTRPLGAGDRLRRLLGCEAKAWSGYREMNNLGIHCLQHAERLAESLVKDGHVQHVSAAIRLIELAVEKLNKDAPHGH